jgi:putative component of membrane protein insertase Oxa1/YidC/SpoIIIJ protein YidD
MHYLGQTLLVGLIRFYRRFLSGRGPLRRVVCTFCRTESCSAYGLRIAREAATSLPQALRLIRGRLRRCREASLFRFPDGWGWGECYDAPDAAEMETGLQQVHELPATTATVLWSAALIAQHRGDEPHADACAERALQYGEPARYVIVRDGQNLERALRRRLVMHLLVAGVALGVCGLMIPLAVFCLLAVVTVALGVGWWRRYLQRKRRFEIQMAANAFAVAGR